MPTPPRAPLRFGSLRAAFPAFEEAMQKHADGDLAAARRLYGELVAEPALSAACLQQLAVLADLRQEPQTAAGLYRHALRLDSSLLGAYVGLANALNRMGRAPEALDALLDQGCALQAAARFADAQIPYREILSHAPLHYGAYVNLGTCLAQMDRLPDALQQLLQAVTLYGRVHPELSVFARMLVQRLSLHMDCGNPASLPAGTPLGQLEKIEDALTTLGKVLSDLHWLDEAVLCHRQALCLSPGFALAHWNLALALLAQDDFSAGWQEYEWRWHWSGFPEAQRRLPAPRWQGQSVVGKLVLVWAEQGFGDTLQFAPLVRRLAALGATVTFGVMRPLLRLFAHSFEGVSIVECNAAHNAEPVSGAFDFAVALMSLPALLDLQLQSLPLATGYLRSDAPMRASWAQRLPPTDALRVGIVWAGRQKPDPRRSIPFRALMPLFECKDTQWFSLQVGPEQGDLSQAGNTPIANLAAGFTDFADTAAAISQLDLVISIDTAVAHLAAGMGKPVWLLLPWTADWRWNGPMDSNRWYPTMRTFQQSADKSWDSVVSAVSKALDQHNKTLR